MTKTIKYESYLTEQKLGKLLRSIFPTVIDQYRIDRFKVDFFIPAIRAIVEFDGYRHYTDAKCIARDKELQSICQFPIIRIPYWIQMDNSTFLWAFGDKITNKYIHNRGIVITRDYPHGFISSASTCKLPADFTVAGWNKFLDQYSSFIKLDICSVAKDIFASLEDKENFLDYETVYGELVLNKEIKYMMNIYPT